MKNYLLITAIFLLGISNPITANVISEISTDCNKYDSTPERLDQDLVDGNWIVLRNNQKEKFDFHAMGLVDVIPFATNEGLNKSYIWRVENKDSDQILVITNPGNHEESFYLVKGHCNGIQLNKIDSDESLILEFNTGLPKEEISKIKNNIVGDWITNVDQNVIVHFLFREDGSYTRFLGNNDSKIIEHGFWNVSEDGDYLVFEVTDNKTKTGVFKTKFAKLIPTNNGKLNIKSSLSVAGLESVFEAKEQVYSFNRITP